MSSPSNTDLRTLSMVSEATRIAVASPVASVVTILIVASVCGVILATTGQTVRTEQEVLARIDEAGTRLIVAADDQGRAGITPEAVQRVANLSGVEWVLGLGYARDARNSTLGPAGNPVAVRTYYGELPTEIVVNGRQPEPGEGIAGTQAVAALGLAIPVGGVDTADRQVPIVGGFTAADPLGFLETSILSSPRPSDNEANLRSIHVLAETPGHVAALATGVRAVLGAEDPTSVSLETSAALADLRAAVAGELGRFSRQLILAVLAVGLILVSLVVYWSVTLRRSDFGRRRALGATRTALIALVATQNTILAITGAALGTTAGIILVTRLTGGPPDTGFVIAIATLATLTTTLASLPPAIIAAHRDPVRVLRVP